MAFGDVSRSLLLASLMGRQLSARERAVVARMVAGELNKQIAADLGLSEVTVKLHRANAMHKMRAKSLAELVRMVDLLEIAETRSEAGFSSMSNAAMLARRQFSALAYASQSESEGLVAAFRSG